MDISSLIGTFMSSDALQNIGSAAQTDAKSAKDVLAAALPSLLSGAKAQSDDESTGFGEALLSHGKDDISDIASFLGKVDLEDGGKIIGHLFGNDSDNQIGTIAESAGVSKANTSNILSAAAPLLMSLLGQQASSSASDSSASALSSVASLFLKNADIGGILGGILGGGNNNSDEIKIEDANTTTSAKPAGLISTLLGKLFGRS